MALRLSSPRQIAKINRKRAPREEGASALVKARAPFKGKESGSRNFQATGTLRWRGRKRPAVAPRPPDPRRGAMAKIQYYGRKRNYVLSLSGGMLPSA